MRLDKILAGAAFRSALLFLPPFLLVLFAAGAFILNVSIATLYDELRAQIGEERAVFEDIYNQDGAQDLIDTINALDRANVSSQRMVGLFDASGHLLAGNAGTPPDFAGWGTLAAPPDVTGANLGYYGIVEKLGPDTIVVARSPRHIVATRQSLFGALVVAGVLVTLIALAIGFAMSRRSGEKLDRIAGTLERVSHGETGVRLPIGRDNDQIDRISTLINQHLERLLQLMSMTRNTVFAIAHDLKSPLNRASLSLQQALMKHAAEKDEAQQLEQALGDLEHVASVFDTMLRIARITATDDQAGFTVFAVRPLIEEMADTYEPVIEVSEQVLDLDVDDPTGAEIRGDRKMIMQMLANLIENANRYAGEGARIRLGLLANPDGTVVEVSDNGPGIPPEQREEMLQPFHRLATGGHDQGTGLGLALVQAIATRHRADLRLTDNHPGLRITVLFPHPDADAEEHG